MYDHHFKGEYPFRVVEPWLYYQISPYVYHFPKFVSYLATSYVEDKNCFVSSIGVKIMEINPELFQKDFIYLVTLDPEKFTETTLFYSYNALLIGKQQAFL